jgi:di/tripeptidase
VHGKQEYVDLPTMEKVYKIYKDYVTS